MTTLTVCCRLGFGTLPAVVAVISIRGSDTRRYKFTPPVESWETTRYSVQIDHVELIPCHGDFTSLEERVLQLVGKARSHHQIPYRAATLIYDITNDPSFRARKRDAYIPRYAKIVHGDADVRRDKGVEIHSRLRVLSNLKVVINPRGPSFLQVLDFEAADDVERALIEITSKPPPREPQDFAAVTDRTQDDTALAIAIAVAMGPKYRAHGRASTPVVVGSGQ